MQANVTIYNLFPIESTYYQFHLTSAQEYYLIPMSIISNFGNCSLLKNVINANPYSLHTFVSMHNKVFLLQYENCHHKLALVYP